jgi:dihydrofolate reductase
MSLSGIVAMSLNRVIGRGNALPWRLPADLARFKQLTMGHTLVMGRRTWESIGRPLPGRTSVVVTRQRHFAAPTGVHLAHSLDEALALAQGDSEPFVIGGADLFAQALPRLTRLHLTLIEADVEGDVYFPPLELSQWRRVADEPHPASDGFPHPYRFLVYERS